MNIASTRNIKINTTNVEFNELHRRVDSARKGSEEVKVSKEALWHLLLDHSILYGAATKNNAEIESKEE